MGDSLGEAGIWKLHCTVSLASCRLRAESLARRLHSKLWTAGRYDNPGTSRGYEHYESSAEKEQHQHGGVCYGGVDDLNDSCGWHNPTAMFAAASTTSSTSLDGEDYYEGEGDSLSSPPSPVDTEEQIIVNPPVGLGPPLASGSETLTGIEEEDEDREDNEDEEERRDTERTRMLGSKSNKMVTMGNEILYQKLAEIADSLNMSSESRHWLSDEESDQSDRENSFRSGPDLGFSETVVQQPISDGLREIRGPDGETSDCLAKETGDNSLVESENLKVDCVLAVNLDRIEHFAPSTEESENKKTPGIEDPTESELRSKNSDELSEKFKEKLDSSLACEDVLEKNTLIETSTGDSEKNISGAEDKTEVSNVDILENIVSETFCSNFSLPGQAINLELMKGRLNRVESSAIDDEEDEGTGSQESDEEETSREEAIKQKEDRVQIQTSTPAVVISRFKFKVTPVKDHHHSKDDFKSPDSENTTSETSTTVKTSMSIESMLSLPFDLADEEDDEEGQRRVLLRSTSLKTGKTPPGTPRRKKIVRFADALGLDLEAVRHIVNDDIPNVPASAFTDLKNVESGPVFLPIKTSKIPDNRVLYPQFAQPVTDPYFLERIRTEKVCLENIVVSDLSLYGVVRVLNICFEKSVLVRYTTDDWRSMYELPATFVPGSSDGMSDRFRFVLHQPALSPGQRLILAMRYLTGGQEYWDNNYGHNYILKCHVTSTCPSESSCSMGVYSFD